MDQLMSEKQKKNNITAKWGKLHQKKFKKLNILIHFH